MLSVAFVYVACILLLLAGCSVPSGRASLGWLGMFFYVASHTAMVAKF